MQLSTDSSGGYWLVFYCQFSKLAGALILLFQKRFAPQQLVGIALSFAAMILIVIPLPQNKKEKSQLKKESYSSDPNEYQKAETLPFNA